MDRSGSRDAVAVIGMSCRFAPDLRSPESFWDFLLRGRSSVGEMPERRWKPYAQSGPQATAALRGTVLRGSYLDDIEGFDAEFFGISPREADFIDPQQRFMLELAWEALSDAGVPPLGLKGTQTSVYMAANSNDYGRRLLEDLSLTDAYAVNGTTFYGIANRISYFLDLRGSSMAVDTACAGSLTALHVACSALRDGQTPLSIVGGVNIMSTPALNVALNGAGAMSPDGRSKAFDREADGYGRGEGAGVLVLKRLADALTDGDRVLAVVRGSGVFQDGRSEGMMAPNGAAQEDMLRRVYERAGVDPATVDYVEAHGTGTPSGDMEELSALAGVLGAGRSPQSPCLVGSVKPNIGHIEGGSGIAGVIKTILALEHGLIPRTLYGEPHAGLDWDTCGLRLTADNTVWPTRGEDVPRRAGVSSYGVGGTISHVLLEEAPEQVNRGGRPTAADRNERARPAVFPISAASEKGLRELATDVADWIEEHSKIPLASVGHTLVERRSHLPRRGAVVAGTREELVTGLRGLALAEPRPRVVTGRAASGGAGGPVWVFSGHGAQWSGMGRDLIAREPLFAEALDSLGDVFEQELGWTPREVLAEGGTWSASQVQALTFAIQIGISAVWRGHGVVPDAVIGHSVGEIAACVAAGALDLQEAARFACRRAAALRRLEGRGAMAMVGLPFESAAAELGGIPGVEAVIASSPESTVVSGGRAEVERVADHWRDRGLWVREVDSDIAFHSAQVEEVMGEVAEAAGALTPRTPSVPLYSTALADPRSDSPRSGAYWETNLRSPVRFTEAVEAALEDGHRVFLEISSHPVVTHSIQECALGFGADDTVVVPSLQRSGGETTLLENLAGLHCNGVEVELGHLYGVGGPVPVPSVAWQHRPYWIFPEEEQGAGTGGGHDPGKHSLLGGRMTVTGPSTRHVWQTRLDMRTRPYPQSHGLVGVEVTPAASIINTFAEASGQEGERAALDNVVLRTPLAVEPARVVQVVREDRALSLSTRLADGTEEEDSWITHTTAVAAPDAPAPEGYVDSIGLRSRLPEGDLDRADVMFGRMGVEGYAFPWTMEELRHDEQEQFAVLEIEPAPASRASSWAHVIDGALTVSAMVVSPGDATTLWMSRAVEAIRWRGAPPARITVHSERSALSWEDTVDVRVADENGEVVCVVTGLRFAAVDRPGTTTAPRDLVHEIAWSDVEAGKDDPDGLALLEQVVLVSGTSSLSPIVRAAGPECVRVASTEEWGPELFTRPGAVVIDPGGLRDGESLEEAVHRMAWELISTVKRVAASEQKGGAAPQRVWCVTRGVRSALTEESLAHGSLWGTARIIAGEHPEIWGGVVDLDGDEETDAEALLDVLRHRSCGIEDVVSLRGASPAVARATRMERGPDRAPLRCSPSGTFLVTGGLGALGLEAAEWLSDRGARRLVLVGRSALPPRSEWDLVRGVEARKKIEAVLALEARGVTVRTLALDITDEEAVRTALAPKNLGLPPISGIVHAAGVVNDAMVSNTEPEGLHSVLAPKVRGSLVLHRLFPPGSLDFFALFSSCGQFARLSGQVGYATANSFLDVLAAHRGNEGYDDTVSLGWAAWKGTGLSADIGTVILESNSRGLGEVTVSEALAAWEFGSHYKSSYQAVLRALPTSVPRPPLLRDLQTAEDAGSAPGSGNLDVGELPEEEARRRVMADVQEQVAFELRAVADEVEPRRPLVEMGVDSVMTVALRVRLRERYGIDLPPTILWAKPTVEALAEHILETLVPAADDASPTVPDSRGVLKETNEASV